MGCTGSSRASVRDDVPSNSSIQDEARSFRSKLGAIKLLMRNQESCDSFMMFLQSIRKDEFLTCYRDIEEIKTLDEDQRISRSAALLWRYKSMCETIRALGQVTEDCTAFSVYECFGKLRFMNLTEAPTEYLMKYLVIAQNEILSRIVVSFEQYLLSSEYRRWQEGIVEREKERERARKAGALLSVNRTDSVSVNSTSSRLLKQQFTPSAKFPFNSRSGSTRATTGSVLASQATGLSANVLVVDDSTVTLKLAGLTLEKDGHCVDKAINGQAALMMMKSREYDVVLIDCNMPVMDGFEAVRLFREFELSEERNIGDDYAILENDNESDVSSLSGDSDSEQSHRIKSENELLRMATPQERERLLAERRKKLLRNQEKRRMERSRQRDKIKEYESSDFRNPDAEINSTEEKDLSSSAPVLSEKELLKMSHGDKFNDNNAIDPVLSMRGAETSIIVNKSSPSTSSRIPLRSFGSRQGSTSRVAPELTSSDFEPEFCSKSYSLVASLPKEHYHQLIIGMSTNVDEETRKRALDAGMDAFLPKPFTLEKFVETIRLSRVARQDEQAASESKLRNHSVHASVHSTMRSTVRTNSSTFRSGGDETIRSLNLSMYVD